MRAKTRQSISGASSVLVFFLVIEGFLPAKIMAQGHSQEQFLEKAGPYDIGVTAVPSTLSLLGWALVNSGGNPGGFGVNNSFSEVNVAEQTAREFTLELLDGSTLALSDLRGRAVMLNFWASWCPPCRREAPGMVEAYREYAGQPVEFVGIDIWDRRESALKFIDQYQVTYPNGIDDKGTIIVDYGVTGIPETLFIGCDGALAKKFSGPISADKLRSVLDEMLFNPACALGDA